MKINNKCSLILNDLFLYDFSKCYPRLLKNLNWNFEGIDLENKEQRNIYLGTLQKDKKYLYSYLSDSVDDLIEYYLESNNVKHKNIIISQKDGFIIKCLLNNISDFMELDFRGYINFIILSPDRKKYLYQIENEIAVKGISNIYNKLYDVYSLFNKLIFHDKKILFSQLDYIKQYVYNNDDKEFFIITTGDKKFIQANSGIYEIRNINDFSLKNINKEKYFNHYFKEFLDSIFLQFY